MSRRRRKAPASASLKLPHGEPAPPRPSARRAFGEPEVEVNRRGGTYTQVGYRSQRIADREGRSASRAGAIAHERIDRLKLQYQSREFVRTNGLYRGMLFRARSYIVKRGFKIICRTKSSGWNKKTEKAFARWWKNPDVKGELSGPRFEAMVCDELLTCGDLGVIPVETKKGDKLQLVEAEQIIGQNWLKQGIDRDDVGAPIRFWVSPYDPNTGYPERGKAKAFKPETFFYVSSPERVSSNRAVPPAQASFPMLHRINDVLDSEAIAWQMQARIGLISNRATNPIFANGADASHDDGENDDAGDATSNYFTELPYALIFHGKPGETVSGMERTAPGSQFVDSVTMFFRLLGLPLGLPLELILLDWTNSNYSQSRAVLEQAYETFLAWQELLVDLFHDRVFEWWLLRSIARGEIEDRDDKLEHDWILPTFPWIDQLNEAQAQGEKIDRGFTTHTEVCKSLDKDREKVLEDLERETVEAIELSQRVEELTGVKVPWEQFAGKKALPAPSAPAGSSVTGAKEDPGSKKDPKKDPKKKDGKQPGKDREAKPAKSKTRRRAAACA